jgi:hypothetical protein
MEKHTRKMLVCGYDSGRSRLRERSLCAGQVGRHKRRSSVWHKLVILLSTVLSSKGKPGQSSPTVVPPRESTAGTHAVSHRPKETGLPSTSTYLAATPPHQLSKHRR